MFDHKFGDADGGFFERRVLWCPEDAVIVGLVDAVLGVAP
jgi:hypothetical protein